MAALHHCRVVDEHWRWCARLIDTFRPPDPGE